jgi:D-alanyl-lipoteichoic acid acyltransferase DltB (MBOAT superfamily)
VAGPIVRAVDFEEQCERERGLEVGRVCWGLVLALWGITQKVVFSDGYLARVADEVYGETQAPGLVDAWVGTLAFSGQIYFDFAGYSLCAIGLAIALGFDLPKNFHAPYASTGFSDFWRRWHISLSTWLRDYLYISLGGNRGSAQRTYFNLFMTMVLGGLWHGASWNFLLWGALHGAFLIAERLLRPWIDGWRWARGALGAAAGMALTYVLVCVAWVPFRAKDLTATLGVWAGMVGANPATALSDGTSQLYAMLVVLLMLVGHNVMRRCELDEVAGAVGWPGLALGVMGCIWLLLTHVGIGGHEFIYFQF